jgi:hypothetical protein
MTTSVGRVALAVVIAIAAGLVASGPAIEPRLGALIGESWAPGVTVAVELPELAAEEVAAVEGAWRRRLAGHGVRTRPAAPPDDVVVDVIGTGDAAAVLGALTATGAIELRWVIADTPAATAMSASLSLAPIPGVDAAIDRWDAAATGRVVDDAFLFAGSVEALDAAVAALRARDPATRLAPGHELRVGRIVPPPDADDTRPYYRTYVVDDTPILTDADVESAITLWDPQTQRPQVLLTFTAEGARRFGAETARHPGDKLAILRDGVVASAPVVDGEIPGGRVAITMGDGPPAHQQADADALVAALRTDAALPPGITARVVSVHAPSAATRWTLRLALAVLAGLVTWIGATAVARRGWLPARPPAVHGGRAVDVVAVAGPVVATAAVLAGVILLERIPLPNLDRIALPSQDDHPRGLSVMALGIAPVLWGFAAVELVARLVPRWRGPRRGKVSGRRTLDRAVGIVLVAYAAVLGWQFVELAEPILVDAGAVARASVVASLVGGVMLHVIAAERISRFGLCSGWAALFGIVAVRALEPALDAPSITGVSLACAAIAVVAVTRRGRVAGAGIAPLLVGPMVIAVIALPIVRDQWRPRDVAWLVSQPLWVDALWYAAIAAALTARPRAVPAAAGFVLALIAVPHLAGLPSPGAQAVYAAIAGVAAAELAIGVIGRARIPDAVVLVAIHDLGRADAAAAALAAAGIPVAVSGAAMRGLLGVFGAPVPVTILVAPARLDDAARIAQPHLEPAIGQVDAVFA